MAVPMFSIVVPVYNVEKYLEICINSILSQTFQDFELILVDDGSTDSSGTICDSYQTANPEKIKVIHRSNGGLLSARIAGLHETKGRYIYNVDSDDFLAFDLLEKVKAAIDKSGADVIVFSAIRIDDNGNLLYGFASHLFPEGNVDLYNYWFTWADNTNLNVVWLKVIKRDLLDQQFEKNLKDYIQIQNGEDLIYSITVIRNASSIYYLDQALYYYRYTPKSITVAYHKNEHLILQYEVSYFLNSMTLLGFDNPEIRKQRYRSYPAKIWHFVCRVVTTNRFTVSEKKEILRTIRSYETVQQAYGYLSSSNTNSLWKTGLIVFYKFSDKNISVLWIFSQFYNLIRRIKQS